MIEFVMESSSVPDSNWHVSHLFLSRNGFLHTAIEIKEKEKNAIIKNLIEQFSSHCRKESRDCVCYAQ